MNERYKINPTRLTVERITRDVVHGFLAYLEQERRNSMSTRNQRLAAIHSLFRFIGQDTPELLGLATQIHDVPLRKAPIPTMSYLEKNEMDALLATPDRSRPQGRRDYALLLFLYNSGARASEAAWVTVGALNLGDPASVRILGKGSKTRLCPLWAHTSAVLTSLLGPRVHGPPDAPAFLNVRGAQITRYGVHAMVERTAEKAAQKLPSLRDKQVSPHTMRHYIGFRTMSRASGEATFFRYLRQLKST